MKRITQQSIMNVHHPLFPSLGYARSDLACIMIC